MKIPLLQAAGKRLTFSSISEIVVVLKLAFGGLMKDLPSISMQLLRDGLTSSSPEIAEAHRGRLSSNVPLVEFEDDPKNPVFSARLHYSGTGPRVGLAVDVVWTNGQEQRFRYHLPNAWGWAARTILKRAPNGVAVAASDMGSPTGGSQLQYMTVYTSDINYGVWNGTQSNVFINYTWGAAVSTVTIFRRVTVLF